MSDENLQTRRKAALLKLAVAGVLVVVAAAVVLHFVGLDGLVAGAKKAMDTVKTWSKTVGPVPFFAAMALLPAIGFPLMAFSLSAGVLFVPQIGLAWTIVAVLVSLGINLSLTYWLARYALRPLLERLMRRLGYGLPAVSKEDHLGMALLLRIMPGPPFFVQGYLLGLAEVPFGTYMAVSWGVSATYTVALVVLGDSIMQGNAKVIFMAVSIFIVVMVAIKMVRRHLALRKNAAAAEAPGDGA